jgi:hypothetical protein
MRTLPLEGSSIRLARPDSRLLGRTRASVRLRLTWACLEGDWIWRLMRKASAWATWRFASRKSSEGKGQEKNSDSLEKEWSAVCCQTMAGRLPTRVSGSETVMVTEHGTRASVPWYSKSKRSISLVSLYE